MRKFACLAFVLLSSFVLAQDAKKDYSADTKSVDSTIKALYDVISGGKGVARDWDRFRNLFSPTAKMIPTVKRNDKFVPIVITPEDYVTRSGPMLEKEGFFETELGRRVETYGPVASVWTAYEYRMGTNEGKPAARGINTVQLTFDGDRWWVQSIAWADEATAGPLPKDLIKD